MKFSWERKFTSRRFQIRLEGLRITWLREKVFSWPVDKLLDGRSRGRGSWQESGLKSYLTISSNAWIMEIESVGLYLQEGIIRRMLLGGENSRVSSTIPSGGRTRSLFDLTIVDWNCITRSANGFKFYSFRVKTDPIIQFPYYVRVNVIISHSNLKITIHIMTNVSIIFQCKYQKIFQDIYFVINFEFTQVSFYLSKLRFLENFPINCRIVTIFISFQRKYNFQESDVFLCRSMYHLIEREKKAWLTRYAIFQC